MVDGRRARRERGRMAVIEAMIDLVQSGHAPPSADTIAESAGVSVSSLFRYFDGLDDLQNETAARFFERYAELFGIDNLGVGDLDRRIATLVSSRLTLYDTVAPMARLARARALEHPNVAASVAAMRSRQADDIRHHFGDRLRPWSTTEGDDVVDAIYNVTSFESWDILNRDRHRSTGDIRRSWTRAVRALLMAG
jgi:AcrR family transcriptional regulator